MYFYCVSYGEYEQYQETILFHDTPFTEAEFKAMVEKSDATEDLCEQHGFKELEIQAHHHYAD